MIEVHPNFPLGMLAGEFYDRGHKIAVTRRLRFLDPEHGIDIEVPELVTSDFNSIPRLVWWFLAKWEHPEAGVVHDWIFRHPPEGWTRENCDWVHWRILMLTGMPKWKAEIVFQILSKASGRAWKNYRKLENER